MEEIKLSDDIFVQIKDFDNEELTEEQDLLIDKLILNDELKKRYKHYGLCEECKQPNTGSYWCQLCNAKHFQQNFENWTSENHDIDELIQNTQLNAKCYEEVLEWIEYDRFENVEYIGYLGFGDVYKVELKDGLIYRWDSENNQWKRSSISLVLICLPNSTNITVEVLKEIEPRLTDTVKKSIACHGITKDPETYNFMIVMHSVCDLCKECKQPNTDPSWCQSCNTKHFQQNFKNWTSGNHDIDELIQIAQLKAKSSWEVLEWIEYDRFENAEYLAKGGFGTVYKAIWKNGYIKHWDSKNNQWKRNENHLVALKCLHDSQDIAIEFLKEVELHLKLNGANFVVHCFGITKDPETNNFMMVLYYAKNGSLRQHLNNRFNLLDWDDKFTILYHIVRNLNIIHDKRLIHRDFHCGNILSTTTDYNIVITDLGLCQPANLKPSKPSQSDNKQIFGVLPYVAPEVLRGKDYTQASDIYAFGIIAHEVWTGLPPYHDMSHDELSAISICNGLRPKSDYKIPQLILDIIKQCWNADPLKRPNAKELCTLLGNLYDWEAKRPILLFGEQIEEADRINKQLSSTTTSSSSTGNLSYTTHPQSVYISRLLDFKNLPEPKNADNLESMAMDFIKLGI